MLGAVIGRTLAVQQPAAAWLRRPAAVLAVLVAVVAGWSPACADGMATDMAAMPSTSMIVDGLATSRASVPSGLCPAPVAGRTADLRFCVQAPPAAVNVVGAGALTGARGAGYAVVPLAGQSMTVTGALRHAATLHQLGVLRT